MRYIGTSVHGPWCGIPPTDGLRLWIFYQRKKQAKGAGKAIYAAARKLLTVVYVILTKALDYGFLEERLYQKELEQLVAA